MQAAIPSKYAFVCRNLKGPATCSTIIAKPGHESGPR
jgi:hypothetical protein